MMTMAATTTTTATIKKTTMALIMGVANHRSIAWACVESFLQDYDCIIFTYQNERFAKTANDLVRQADATNHRRFTEAQSTTATSHVSTQRPPPQPTSRLIALPCNVETELSSLFHERIPEALFLRRGDDDSNPDADENDYKMDAIVHSIAYAPDMHKKNGGGGLLQTSREAFLQAHAVSAYSLLETTRLSLPYLRTSTGSSNYSDSGISVGSSITTLSYLGATRAVPHYNIMGPAKASLEALVRGLALEIGTTEQGHCHHRINAVSAGPINTLAARGIVGLSRIREHVAQHAPLRQNVTARQVADTVRFVASAQASGLTGQTIHVDAGYSSIVPVS
jgi:enoyl-[acyl-carrier protein] reductase I